jgi:hypothetical protein
MPISDFLGTWELASWRITGPDGQARYPLGPAAQGRLVYTADGAVFAALMAPGRPLFQGADPLAGSAEECLGAMHGYHTYCGRYRVEAHRVIHTVELSLFPNMVGSEQVRYYRFDGGRLILSTPPMNRGGVTGSAELIWQRAS